MKFYDIQIIKTISEVFGPQYGRALEIGILAGISYILGAVITGDIYSFQALVVSIITPIWAAINKKLRDSENAN